MAGNKFFRTDIKGFDNLLRRGIPQNSNIIVEGGPGTGKTIFCLNIVNNACMRGERCFYMSFEEPEHRLKAHMKSFGWEPERFEKKKLLKIKEYNPLEITRSIEALLSKAEDELLIDIDPIIIPKEFNPDVVIVDSLSALAEAFSGAENRFRVYIHQFFNYLTRRNITSFLIREVSHSTPLERYYLDRGSAINFLADGIITIYNIVDKVGRRSSAIEVFKMRGTDIQRKIVEMRILDGKGVEVYPNLIIGETLKRGFSFT